MSIGRSSFRLLGALILLSFVLGTHTTYEEQPAAQTQAKDIITATGVKGGLIVHVGCGDGRLTGALRVSDSYLVHGLDYDSNEVEKAREHIRRLGLYGKVSVEPFAGDRLPYTDNLVNLVVSEDLGNVPVDEVMRVLCPDGVAYIKKDDKWIKTIKPRPREIDEWTHFLHGPDNNAVAHDTLVGPPDHLQWVGGPKWARSHDHLASVSVAVSSGGRLFYIVDEGPIASVALPPKWFLVARDAFNGVVLWKRPVGPWEGHLRGFRSGPAALARRLVAAKDRVFVTLGYGKPVTAIDAATGATLRRYEGTDNTLEIVYWGGTLFLVIGDQGSQGGVTADTPVKKVGDWSWWPIYETASSKRRIMAVKADTGDLLWEKSDVDAGEAMPMTLAVDGGRVFFQNADEVICLDADSGQERWHAPRPISRSRLGWSTPTLVVQNGVVLSADRAETSQVTEEAERSGRVIWIISSKGGDAPPGELIAFSAKTGKRLWACSCRETYNAPVDVLVTGNLVWTGDLVRSRDPGITEARDLLTGEVKRNRPPDQTFFQVGMGHHRCYRNKATDRYLLLGRAGVEFIELASGKGIAHHWVRGTCQYGILPCNGLLYAPPHSCACYIQSKLNGLNALAPKREPTRRRTKGKDDSRLELGPAYGKTIASDVAEGSDWPTYRHDPARSGCTRSAVSPALSGIWQAEVSGRLSSPVIAEGKVFVASVDDHTVHALDADDGSQLWSYTAGGRVDSPPTIYRGVALFGSADGRVYCLRAADGSLVWRFLAAPEDRRVVAYGQLESVWPVHGNVLIQDGTAYFVAGRSSFLDGGIYLYRLDARTGKKLSESCISSRDPETGQEPQKTIRGTDMPGALPDILSSDGQSIYMRHMRFDRTGVEQEPNVPHLFSSVGFLDDTWWHRTYWMVGTKMGVGYGGWPTIGNQVPAGRILVFDESSVYGFGRQEYATHGSHIGLGKTYYRFFACAKQPRVIRTPMQKPSESSAGSRPPVRTRIECRWWKSAPIQAKAMVLADKTLFVAGPPVTGGEGQEAFAPSEETKGALLCAFSAEDGKELAEYKLDSPPVFDGMIAANGRLYISTTDGRLICMGTRR
jgi:outer membrane protein assembly factor BamB